MLLDYDNTRFYTNWPFFTTEKLYAEATRFCTGTSVMKSKKENAGYIWMCDSFANKGIDYLFKKARLSSLKQNV